MDDTCVVCAESLLWVAYGSCGHHEVCSNCIVRLRFICDDRHCCLCKSKSKMIFVTKALGDYTRMIKDFSVFPSNPTEGQVGQYWYHEGVQAYFDDMDHYKMIKEMCRLTCIVCDRISRQRNEGSENRAEFKNVEQLRSHLLHRHRLFMCSLCLEGRKIFICEQKVYDKSQLNRHIKTGYSEFDGSESERGGFMGHPFCKFCQNPFYGDNELYLHMSTEHYTCHICNRRHPGQYEYHKDYEDLEIHFRQEHHLCEDETCLAKKFVVYASESELKRHNAMEHGGQMSRFKRNAVLQIPTSFQYSQRNEQDRRAGFGTVNPEQYHHASSNARAVPNHHEASDYETMINSFESLATIELETPSRQCRASAQNMSAQLEESSFPPLPVASNRSQQKARNNSNELGGNRFATRLRLRNKGTAAVSFSQAWSAASHQPNSSSNLPSSSLRRPTKVNEYLPSINASSSQSRPAKAQVVVSTNFPSSSRNTGGTSQVGPSTSIPNLVDRVFSETSVSGFPTTSASQTNKMPSSGQPLPEVEDVNTANKSLVEKIRAALEFDKNKFSAFKAISAEYRRGLIDTVEYIAYVYQFGLAHLVVELARFCPDPLKQKELVETYNFNMRTGGSNENGWISYVGQSKIQKRSEKGKEKCGENLFNNSKDASADGFINSGRNLQSSYKHSDEKVEVLSKDGYRSAKGKSKISVDDERTSLSSINQSRLEPKVQNGCHVTSAGSKINMGIDGGGNKQRKKTSKFLRSRLGNDAAALSDLGISDPGANQTEEKPEEKSDEDKDSPEGLQVHGVWRNGGGRRLVAITKRDPRKG